MQKLMFFLALTTMLCFLSCQTAPQTAPPPPEPEPEEEVAQVEEVESGSEPIQARETIVVEQVPIMIMVNNLDISEAQRYTVVIGDTLSQITRRFYGHLTDVGLAGSSNGFYYPILILASPESNIVDPDLIFPDTDLNIQDLRRNLANPVSREAIRDFLRQAADIYYRKGILEERDGLLRLANSL